MGNTAIWSGCYGCNIHRDSTVKDVVNCIRSWAEDKARFGESGDYRYLAKKCKIPEKVVNEIEEEMMEKRKIH